MAITVEIPNGGEDLGVVLGLDEVLDQIPLGQGADQEEGGSNDKKGNVRVNLEIVEYPESEIHGEHQEFAVGKIHHVHDPEDQGQADAHQGINPPHEDAADEGLSDDDQHKIVVVL